jgi:hypothetical protein
MNIPRVAFFAIGWAVAFSVSAHDGARDSYGCHPNIAHGTYHCHSGPLADRQFRTKADMLRAFNEQERRVRPKPELVPSRYLQ